MLVLGTLTGAALGYCSSKECDPIVNEESATFFGGVASFVFQINSGCIPARICEGILAGMLIANLNDPGFNSRNVRQLLTTKFLIINMIATGTLALLITSYNIS